MIATEPTAAPTGSPSHVPAPATSGPGTASAATATPFGALLQILLGMKAAAPGEAVDALAPKQNEADAEPDDAPLKERGAMNAALIPIVPYTPAPLAVDDVAPEPENPGGATPGECGETQAPPVGARAPWTETRTLAGESVAPRRVTDASAAAGANGTTTDGSSTSTKSPAAADGAKTSSDVDGEKRMPSVRGAESLKSPVKRAALVSAVDVDDAAPTGASATTDGPTASERSLMATRGRTPSAFEQPEETREVSRAREIGDGGQRSPDPSSRTVAEPAPQPRDVAASATTAAERATPRRPVADQIVGQVASIRHDGRQTMSVRLDPPELGAVHIEAVLDGRHISLEIRTEHAAARAAVEGSLPVIRQALADRGFVADQLSVQLGMETATGGANAGAEHFERPAAPAPREPDRGPAPRARAARVTVEGLDLLV